MRGVCSRRADSLHFPGLTPGSLRVSISLRFRFRRLAHGHRSRFAQTGETQFLSSCRECFFFIFFYFIYFIFVFSSFFFSCHSLFLFDPQRGPNTVSAGDGILLGRGQLEITLITGGRETKTSNGRGDDAQGRIHRSFNSTQHRHAVLLNGHQSFLVVLYVQGNVKGKAGRKGRQRGGGEGEEGGKRES